MSQLLQFFIFIPLLGFLVSMFFPRKKEKAISFTAIATVVAHLLLYLPFVVYWLANGYPLLDIKHIVFFKSNNIEIFIDLYFDRITAVYAFVGSALALLVTIFSRYYIHRDGGFKRYFNTMLLFFLAYNLVIFSGNFETLFIGWEILGVCSFLLITFYRDRYLPAKNGLKVISVYRLGDICLILTMWMSHHLWHENIIFSKFLDTELIQKHILEYNWYAVFSAAMILIAALTKSAQIPFSSWLPRAMEGPTSSSAIFYGSLSVHIGVFLLLRTYPYWESISIIKTLIIVIGAATSIVATSIARVQSSVKTQIAYSSTAQIGLMFIEVTLGFHNIALIHFAGNAFLRTYQLLVSPSVLSYLVHDMVFNFKPGTPMSTGSFVDRIRNSVYVLSIKEWNMDTLQYRYLWNPFKWIGKRLGFLMHPISIEILSVFYLSGLYFVLFPDASTFVNDVMPVLFSLAAFLLILRSFTEKVNPVRWLLIIACQLFITLAVSLHHDDFGFKYVLMFLGGSVVASVVGLICLRRIRSLDASADLNQFHGYSYQYPSLAFAFLVSCLALIGLPFTPTFIGVDVLFSHIHKQEILMMIFIASSFVFMELTALRIYSRIFMGLPKILLTR